MTITSEEPTMRLARIRMSNHLLGDVLLGNWSRLCKRTTAPKDLKVLSVYQPSEGLQQWFYAICESTTFKEVAEGTEIPEIDPFEYTT